MIRHRERFLLASADGRTDDLEDGRRTNAEKTCDSPPLARINSICQREVSYD